MGEDERTMKRRYIIISIVVLWFILAVAWALAYFVAWYWGMGLLSFLVIAAWNETMHRVIESKYK
jgi:fatty acid desaturase